MSKNNEELNPPMTLSDIENNEVATVKIMDGMAWYTRTNGKEYSLPADLFWATCSSGEAKPVSVDHEEDLVDQHGTLELARAASERRGLVIAKCVDLLADQFDDDCDLDLAEMVEAMVGTNADLISDLAKAVENVPELIGQRHRAEKGKEKAISEAAVFKAAYDGYRKAVETILVSGGRR